MRESRDGENTVVTFYDRISSADWGKRCEAGLLLFNWVVNMIYFVLRAFFSTTEFWKLSRFNYSPAVVLGHSFCCSICGETHYCSTDRIAMKCTANIQGPPQEDGATSLIFHRMPPSGQHLGPCIQDVMP